MQAWLPCLFADITIDTIIIVNIVNQNFCLKKLIILQVWLDSLLHRGAALLLHHASNYLAGEGLKHARLCHSIQEFIKRFLAEIKKM